jgi:hypothetical protein
MTWKSWVMLYRKEGRHKVWSYEPNKQRIVERMKADGWKEVKQ